MIHSIDKKAGGNLCPTSTRPIPKYINIHTHKLYKLNEQFQFQYLYFKRNRVHNYNKSYNNYIQLKEQLRKQESPVGKVQQKSIFGIYDFPNVHSKDLKGFFF